jgi:hypothetical protein
MLSTLNDLISRERAGEVIERSLLRATTQVRRTRGPGAASLKLCKGGQGAPQSAAAPETRSV